jgi:ABC-type transport system substrate-binding protein
MKAVALVVVLAACSARDGADVPGPSSTALRFGSHMGLEPMQPLVQGSMSVHLSELVYDRPLSDCFAEKVVLGNELRLQRKDACSHSATDLALAFTHPAKRDAHAEGHEVVVHFDTAETASSITLADQLVALGPYRVDATDEQHLVLTRRDGRPGPARIEVFAVPSEDEEWRRFLSGEFDLMTYAMPGAVSYLDQIPTVRVVRNEDLATAAIVFHVDAGATADVRIRRAIALAVRRKPLAVTVGVGQEFAVVSEENVASARALLAESGFGPDNRLRLRLLVADFEPDLVRAGSVLQQQLAPLGIDLDVRALGLDELIAVAFVKRDFDLVLTRAGATKRYWFMFRSGAPTNFSGFAFAPFDAAADAEREAEIAEIFAREVPLSPLFEFTESVVVSRRLCNVHPKDATDLMWLADVQLCQPGEED